MTSKQEPHTTSHPTTPASHPVHAPVHAEPAHKPLIAGPPANLGALKILRDERAKLQAFAVSPGASKSGESIEAHGKVAFLDALIKQIEAASVTPPT